MSIKLMDKVWEADLGRDEKYILLCLADFGNDAGESIYPSIGYIAYKTQYSETQVKAILRKLRERKIITVGKAPGVNAGPYSRNIYKVNIKALPARDPYEPKYGRPVLTVKEGAETDSTNCRQKEGAETDPSAKKEGADFDKEGAETVHESLDKPLDKNLNTRAEKPDLVDGMIYYQQQNAGRVDVDWYPADVQGIIRLFCETWSRQPPAKTSRDYKLWIEDARNLLEAGGELASAALVDLKNNPYEWMRSAMIARPGALIKAMRARSGDLRKPGSKGNGGWTEAELKEAEAKIRAAQGRRQAAPA